MSDKKEMEQLFVKLGFEDFKWIDAKEIVVANWVRVKCLFGCSNFGFSVCPPNVPDVNDCKSFFMEYQTAVIFRCNFLADKNNYPKLYSRKLTNSLLDLEREVFLKGNRKVFVFNQTCCGLCKECMKNRVDCKNLSKSRPSPEAFAVDVYETVRKFGFEINIVTKENQEINRYALLMIK